MMNYDPNVDSLISPIEDAPVNEPTAKTVPQGLLRVAAPEKKVDESQIMADFSTPIEEVMQNEITGNPYAPPVSQAGPVRCGVPCKKVGLEEPVRSDG
jgi:hypothetical protein